MFEGTSVVLLYSWSATCNSPTHGSLQALALSWTFLRIPPPRTPSHLLGNEHRQRLVFVAHPAQVDSPLSKSPELILSAALPASSHHNIDATESQARPRFSLTFLALATTLLQVPLRELSLSLSDIDPHRTARRREFRVYFGEQIAIAVIQRVLVVFHRTS